MRRHRFAIWLTLAAVGIALAVFAPMHGGSYGDDVCNERASQGPGTVSWWPPGTKCEGGEPLDEQYYLNDLWVLALVLVLVVAVLGGRWLDKRRTQLGASRLLQTMTMRERGHADSSTWRGPAR